MTLELNKKQKEAIIRYLSILNEKYTGQVLEVILHGSVARGESAAESDIDLLVVTTNGGQDLRDEINMTCFDCIRKKREESDYSARIELDDETAQHEPLSE